MKVKNINGTSKNICKCNSWIAHWEKFSEQDAGCCSEISCYESTDLVGAHVQLTSIDMNWYIVPLCKKHNAAIGILELFQSTKIISANIKETCNK